MFAAFACVLVAIPVLVFGGLAYANRAEAADEIAWSQLRADNERHAAQVPEDDDV